MPVSTWLERARAALREQGIPENRQRQFLEELQDHLTDLQEANMRRSQPGDLEQTMGPPEPLAQSLAESYRRERFLVRHPWLAAVAFTVGPVTFHWLLTMLMIALGMIALFILLKTPPGLLPESLAAAFPAIFGVLSGGTAIVVTAWFCVAARRNRLSWRMSLLGSASVALATPLLAIEMFESRTNVVTAALATATAAIATWYLAAWRGNRWRQEPVSLSRRYPLLVSGPCSVVATTACLAGYLILTTLLMFLLVDVIGRPRQGAEFALLAYSCEYVPFAVAACICWRMTIRCRRQRLYSLVACVCVALFATAFTAGVTNTPGEQSSMHFGIGNAFHWSMLAQFATPLAVWGALMCYARQPMRLQGA
jgi:hypothetical protein